MLCVLIESPQMFSVLSEDAAVKQYANNNLSSVHTENLLTEFCLNSLVIVGKYRWD